MEEERRFATCGGCRFYWMAVREPVGADGQCRAHPPTPVWNDARVVMLHLWPRVNEGDWCGDYEPWEGYS